MKTTNTDRPFSIFVHEKDCSFSQEGEQETDHPQEYSNPNLENESAIGGREQQKAFESFDL